MGFIASLPFLLKAIVGPVGGVIADLLRYKYMSTANVRRLFYAIGKFHPFTPHPFIFNNSVFYSQCTLVTY